MGATMDEDMAYLVVVNDEDQHSLWPAHADLPPGWRAVGAPGAKAERLERIRALWTDMTPKSLRRPAG